MGTGCGQILDDSARPTAAVRAEPLFLDEAWLQEDIERVALGGFVAGRAGRMSFEYTTLGQFDRADQMALMNDPVLTTGRGRSASRIE